MQGESVTLNSLSSTATFYISSTGYMFSDMIAINSMIRSLHENMK
jgi:hypothetical protein